MIFDLDKIQETSYLAREGMIRFTVVDHEDGKSVNNNTYHKYVCQSNEGEKTNLFFTLTEDAIWNYKRFLKALGHPAKGVVDFSTLPSKIIGRTFVGEVVSKKEVKNAATGEERTLFNIKNFYPDDIPFN